MNELLAVVESVEKMQYLTFSADIVVMVSTVVMLLILAFMTIGAMWE